MCSKDVAKKLSSRKCCQIDILRAITCWYFGTHFCRKLKNLFLVNNVGGRNRLYLVRDMSGLGKRLKGSCGNEDLWQVGFISRGFLFRIISHLTRTTFSMKAFSRRNIFPRGFSQGDFIPCGFLYKLNFHPRESLVN